MPAPFPVVPDSARLRRMLLAVCVLHDLDLVPDDDAVLLPGDLPVRVENVELRRALSGADPDSSCGRERVARWLRLRRALAERSRTELARLARPVGVPVDSALHPGLDWVRSRILGDALDVGLGLHGLDPADPEGVAVVPASLLRAAGVDADPWWPQALDHLEAMGLLAVRRAERDPAAPLRPMGDCDVVTLLGSWRVRRHLAQRAGGMATVAVPMRTRGWTDLRHIDPAYAVAAAAATAERERGFSRPLLVTAEEVALAAAGGRPAQIVLRDPAPATQWLRDVLYR